MTAEQTEVVMDLMERGPSPTCYDDMKTAYRAAYTNHGWTNTEFAKVGPLTSDQRPSDLLRLIEQIIGRNIDGDEIAKGEFFYDGYLRSRNSLSNRKRTFLQSVS